MVEQTIFRLDAQWQYYENGQKCNCETWGTAFAIRNRILLTCTHNIYDSVRKQFATKIIISYQDSSAQQMGRQQPKQLAAQIERCIAEELKEEEDTFPAQEQLAILVLKQPLGLTSFYEIGSIDPQEQENQIKIIGYRQEKPKQVSSVIQNAHNRYQQIGVLFQRRKKSQNPHVIDYTNETYSGNSGSPVLIQKMDGRYKIVGIHTHGNSESLYSSGLNLNKKILGKVLNFLEKFDQSQQQEYLYQSQQAQKSKTFSYFQPEELDQFENKSLDQDIFQEDFESLQRLKQNEQID